MAFSDLQSDENPYAALGPCSFWRSAVADLNPLSIRNVWKPKYAIAHSDPVSTAGSCFAQHIGRSLVERGFHWVDAEPAPRYLSPADKTRFNYGVFSFRTSNIYTTALLRQWMQWAFEDTTPPDEVWMSEGRFFDPFRPTIEPNGFVSEAELLASRATALAAVREAITTSSVLVFTMGLTEGWVNKLGFVYPTCPGTVAGRFDGNEHLFRNFGFEEVISDLGIALSIARAHNSSLRALLTVSPVPLTATASGEHVLVATTYSKSVLRAVAGEYSSRHHYADYFPSYELVTGVPFRGAFFEPNLRNVAIEGVRFVMDTFFHCMSQTHGILVSAVPTVENVVPPPERDEEQEEDDLVCEEIVLEEFNRS